MSLSQSEIKELIKRVPPPPKKRPEPPRLNFFIRLFLDNDFFQQGYFCRVYINDDMQETDKQRTSAPEKPYEFHFDDIDLSENVLISLYKSNSREVGSMRFPLVSLDINTVTEATFSINPLDPKEKKHIRCALQVATTDIQPFSTQSASINKKSDDEDEEKKSDEDSSEKDKKKHKKDKEKKDKKDKKSRKGK